MNSLRFTFLACTLFCGLVRATITTELDAGAPTPSGPYYLWTYNIDVSADEQLNASMSAPGGTYFTIYDFAGYVPGSIVAPSDWSVSVMLVGETPSLTSPPDDPSLWNLVFTYTGSLSTGPLGPIDGFSAESIYGQVNTGGYFSYQAQKTANLTSPDQGLGPLDVPLATPEPGSAVLLVAGLISIAASRIRPRLLRR